MLTKKLVRDLFISNKAIHSQFSAVKQHVSSYSKASVCSMPHEARHQIHHTATSTIEGQLDPFALVSHDLSLLAAKIRSMVAAEFPKLASGAEYFLQKGVEGKHFRPTALFLMATAFDKRVSQAKPAGVANSEGMGLQQRMKLIAEIAELIHVGSLLHGEFVDCSTARSDISSLGSMFGNKLAVLFGDFLLSRSYVALASLENTEVLSLLGKVIEHRATGETMQMAMTSDQCLNMDHYMEKTYFKRASLISSSCKAIALIAGQSTEVATLAYDYGKNMGLAHQLTKDVLDFEGSSKSRGNASLSNIRNGIITAPLLYAVEEFPQLREVLHRGFSNPTDVDLALDYLGRSQGIQRVKDLAHKHATKATEAIKSLPFSDDENVTRSRHALMDLTLLVIER